MDGIVLGIDDGSVDGTNEDGLILGTVEDVEGESEEDQISEQDLNC